MSNDFFPLKNGLHQTPPSSSIVRLHQAVVAKLIESLGLTRDQVVYLHLVGPRVTEHIAVLQHPTSGRRYAGPLVLEILNGTLHTQSAPTGARSPYSILAGCPAAPWRR
jgi:hypothetical protein